MSKSLGNIVNPLDLVDQYGVDPVRYYLMAEMIPGNDANFTVENFIKKYNSDLANDFGNLLNRVSGLIGRYFDGCVPPQGEPGLEEKEIIEIASHLQNKTNSLIEHFRVNEAIEETMRLIRLTNKYMEAQAPWKLAKTNLGKAGRVLYAATEALRISAIMLRPIMPGKTKIVLDVLGAENSKSVWGELISGTKLKSHEALFPRIEAKE